MEDIGLIQSIMKAVKKRWGEDVAEMLLAFVGLAIGLWAIKFLLTGIFFPLYSFLIEKGIDSSTITTVKASIAFLLVLFALASIWRIRRLTSQIYKRSKETLKEAMEILKETKEKTTEIHKQAKEMLKETEEKTVEIRAELEKTNNDKI